MIEPVWYGNAGHFCGSAKCEFHLCTEVGKYLVSTVGEYYPDGRKAGMRTLGIGNTDFYETMVWTISETRCPCGCGLPDTLEILDTFRYATPKEANENHRKIVNEYILKEMQEKDTQ